MVSLLDIVPTILDAVKSPSLSNKYDGVSLIPYLDSNMINLTKNYFGKQGM